LGEGATCVAVYAGLHGIAQGLDQIIEAARILHDLEGKLKIVLIGDGPEKESLMRQAREVKLINFLPPRPKEDIPELLASADIALVPLRTYIPGAVPSKIYEAMASALPVVLIAEGESVKILNESESGIAIPPGAVNDLAQALKRLTLDEGLRKRFGANGRQAAIKRFDRKKIIDDFLYVLEDKL
jgi:glycosyltransferase involved in cell wall biosynthesis